MSYKKYLQSKHWKGKRDEVYGNRRYQCSFCLKRNNLEIHHISYDNVGKEDMEDLVYLCRSCHQKASKSDQKEHIQKWLDRVRNKKIKQRKKFGNKAKSLKERLKRQKTNRRNYYKKRIKPRVYNKPKNHAGLFTWKTDELDGRKAKRTKKEVVERTTQ